MTTIPALNALPCLVPPTARISSSPAAHFARATAASTTFTIRFVGSSLTRRTGPESDEYHSVRSQVKSSENEEQIRDYICLRVESSTIPPRDSKSKAIMATEHVNRFERFNLQFQTHITRGTHMPCLKCISHKHA